MSDFTDDFQRRLRAVLAAKTGRDIPKDAVVEIEMDAAGNQDDSRGLDRWITLRAVGGMCLYDEPGAFTRLVAELDAVPDQ